MITEFRQRISLTGFRDHGPPHCGPAAGRDLAGRKAHQPEWRISTATLGCYQRDIHAKITAAQDNMSFRLLLG